MGDDGVSTGVAREVGAVIVEAPVVIESLPTPPKKLVEFELRAPMVSVIALVTVKSCAVGRSRGGNDIVLFSTEEQVGTTFAIDGVIALYCAD